MLHGTFDMHRVMPFEFIRTQIKIFDDGKPGGSNQAGPLQGARAVHWNLEIAHSNEWVYQTDVMPMCALVGVRGMPINKSPAKAAMVNGDKGCLVADEGKIPQPQDLFEAQLRLKLSTSYRTLNH